VDGQVDVAAQEGLLDLLREQPLAAEVGQRAVLHLVAGGFDEHELDEQAGVGLLDRVGDLRLCVRASTLPRVPRRRGAVIANPFRAARGTPSGPLSRYAGEG
jgi:hypothetical protein